MVHSDTSPSWFGASGTSASHDAAHEHGEFARLWQGFLTARVTLGAVLLALQVALYVISATHSKVLVGVSLVYFGATLLARIYATPQPLGNAFSGAWLHLVGLDVLTYLTLQALQGSSINYTPLCALPVLMTSVLGTVRLSLGTAAGITMLLMGGTWWAYLDTGPEVAPHLAQAALSGVGYFVIALLSSQVASRVASEGQRARSSQLAANIQRKVNELVIESLPDGVLIVDDRGCVRAANPAARMLLGSEHARNATAFMLREEPGWEPLVNLTELTTLSGESQEADVSIRHQGHGPQRLHARTRLAAPHGQDGESLCVVFLQDQRELEARMRTEKLASMGRMSSAVAHEIRNPLAAIAQANALLDEDLSDPRLKKLTQMVSQNARRLDRIVDDILKVSRLSTDEPAAAAVLEVHTWTAQISQDWMAQTQAPMEVQVQDAGLTVRFDPDHLRRVLVNLLDNARRYASGTTCSIQVRTHVLDGQSVEISVWSDGAPMDQTVERHLFEPFFSSESRSTGLGLYICRELCARHGATVSFQRSERLVAGATKLGNEFIVTLQRAGPSHPTLLEKVSAAL